MSMRLSLPEIKWFCNEYQSGRTLDEISVDTGFSKQNIKRALAEGNLIYLTWYKTSEEDAILKYLRRHKITSLNQVRQYI